MRVSLALVFSLLFIALVTTVNAVSEPVCGYENSEGEMVFLKYFPLLQKGQDYVDFGSDGKCVKRAMCSETFQTEVEECAKYTVTCANKNRYTGVFPACCIKC